MVFTLQRMSLTLEMKSRCSPFYVKKKFVLKKEFYLFLNFHTQTTIFNCRQKANICRITCLTQLLDFREMNLESSIQHLCGILLVILCYPPILPSRVGPLALVDEGRGGTLLRWHPLWRVRRQRHEGVGHRAHLRQWEKGD